MSSPLTREQSETPELSSSSSSVHGALTQGVSIPTSTSPMPMPMPMPMPPTMSLEPARLPVSHAAYVHGPLSPSQSPSITVDVDSEGQHEIDETGASLVAHRLTWRSWLFFLSLIVVEIVIATNPTYSAFAITFPLFFLPSLLLGYWWYENRSMTRLDTVVTSFALGFWPGTASVASVQLFLAWLVLQLLYRLNRNLFLIVLALVIAAPEEILKYLFSRSKLAQNAASVGTKANLIYSTSAALGYATFSTFLYSILIVAATIGWRDSSFEFGYSVLFYSFFLCLFAFLPVHVLTAYLIGLKVHMRTLVPEAHLKLRHIIGIPILARWALLVFLFYNLVFLIQFHMNAALVLLLDVLFSLVLVLTPLLVHIRKTEQHMPLGYLRRVGALSMLGYGVLSDGGEQDGRMLSPPRAATSPIPAPQEI